MQLSELLDLGTRRLCGLCPARLQCLAGLVQGAVVARKRPRGRPRTHPVAA